MGAAAGLREWAPGIQLPEDLDSGPIVAGVGAAATALGNIIKKPSDIQKAIDTIKSISGIRGIVAIKGDHIGLWGDLQIVRLS
jgi:hypothetical protein